jgi:hypothetical protein
MTKVKVVGTRFLVDALESIKPQLRRQFQAAIDDEMHRFLGRRQKRRRRRSKA